MSSQVTIFGQIARHNEPVFWGRITVSRETGRIVSVERGMVFTADHTFGPECVIFAGFGDVHIHAREDNTGQHVHKEDYTTAAAAALNGGVVHVSAMPNTPDPVTGGQQLQWHRNRVRELDLPVVILNYLGVDGTTRPLGKKGEYPYKCYFGKSVGTLTVTYAGELDEILEHYQGEYVSFHVEYEPIVQMSAGGETHSDRRPRECVMEGLRLLLTLIEKHKIKAKLCHWSLGRESFKLIAEYRARGCKIVLEVSPLHLWFNRRMADAQPSLWLQIQMNPAIQEPEDQLDLIEGLRTAFIDFLANDHASHTEEEKYSAFEVFKNQFRGKTNKQVAEIIRKNSPDLFHEYCKKNGHSGAPWLDTHALICCWLMIEHGFTTQDIARVAAYNPGVFVNRFLPAQFPDRDFGKGFGDVAVDYMGSFTVLNLEGSTTVVRENLKTKVGWSPLEGLTLPGRLEAVFIEGVRH